MNSPLFQGDGLYLDFGAIPVQVAPHMEFDDVIFTEHNLFMNAQTLLHVLYANDPHGELDAAVSLRLSEANSKFDQARKLILL